MSITFVDNSDEILRALGEACERGLFRCGEKAVEYAKDLCPVDTGNLRNSITHTVEDGKKAIVGTPTEYAIYQEMGTGKYAEGGGGRPTPWKYQDAQGIWHWTAGNRAHPFIKPSIADHQGTYKNILKDELSFESGLAENSEWAQNEEMVDFFAIQFPKLMEAFKNADAI